MAKESNTLSDMMRHYLDIKEQYKDCIVFYRLGDFYEMFFEDAKEASRLLDITLTGRDCGMETRAPMCGVPYHAVDEYIAKLVSLDKKVAICEQLEQPVPGQRGLVKRDVVRVVTPGTTTISESLDEKRNNYICSAYKEGGISALAWADITTGELSSMEFHGGDTVKKALAQMQKLEVREIICNDEMLFAAKDCPEVTRGVLPKFSSYLAWTYNYATAERNLLSQLKAQSLAAFPVADKKYAVCALGGLLEYLKETQKHALVNIDSVKYEGDLDRMQLDGVAIRNLEIVKSLAEGKKFGSLLWLLDKTETSMGARLLGNMIVSPLKSAEQINYRLDGVEELFNATVVRLNIKESLGQIKDIERLSGRISNNVITPKNCLELSRSLFVVPNLKFQLSGFTSRVLTDIERGLKDLTDIAQRINSAIKDEEQLPANIKDGGYIRDGYDAQLDEYRKMMKGAGDVLADLESREREATGIRTLKVGYNRVFGYYIEVSKSFKDKVPMDYHRKQTLVNAERYVTDELKVLEEKILTASENALKLEENLYAGLKSLLLSKIDEMKSISRSVARLDVLAAFAEISKKNKYVRPKITDSDGPMIIKDGRHPVVEVISKEKFVANDTLLDTHDNRTLIITGPNMAGKSTYMRQNAIIAIMAHLGCFVPAREAQIPIIDRIFTRVGASDNLIYDQSTFMVEMIEVASILQNATGKSLLILDEVGRGTSTYDGLSIAWAVIEYINQKIGAKTLFATHYHELLALENTLSGVKNYKSTVKEFEGKIMFLRKIMRGGANRSFGIEVASLAGVPSVVTERAKIILKSVEHGEIGTGVVSDDGEEVKRESEVEKIIKEIDMENLSPMQAFMILGDLKDKIKG